MGRSIVRAMATRARKDPRLRQIAERAREVDAPVWVVGGFVRDAALGRRSADLDLAVGGRARKLVEALEIAWARRSFRFRKRGVTTWRFDLPDRSVDVVDASRRGIDADLRRRELTINAIAFDLLRREVHDPTGGIRDLEKRILRFPRRSVVREDPVRALRAARFLAELPDFRLQRGAASVLGAAARALRRASVERVRDEIDRLLVAESPERGLRALADWGLLPAVLPELVPMRSCKAGAGRPDVWRHTLGAIEASKGRGEVRDPEDRRVLRWTLLLHDVAKPDTLRIADDGRPTFHGHESRGARVAEALLRRLRASGALKKRVRLLVLLHLRPGHLADSGASERALRRLVEDAGPDLPLLVVHAACDAQASGGPPDPARMRRLRRVLRELRRRFEAARVHPLPRLVSGDDVMASLRIPPGPEVGRALAEIRGLQQDGVLTDRAAALAFLRSRVQR